MAQPIPGVVSIPDLISRLENFTPTGHNPVGGGRLQEQAAAALATLRAIQANPGAYSRDQTQQAIAEAQRILRS